MFDGPLIVGLLASHVLPKTVVVTALAVTAGRDYLDSALRRRFFRNLHRSQVPEHPYVLPT